VGDVVKQSIEIRAPIDEVWDLVMDPNRFGEWVAMHEEVFDLPDGELGEGSEFGQRMKLKGVPLKVRWRIEEWDPPRHALWRGEAAAGAEARILYDLSERDGVTVFDYENEFDLPAGRLGRMAGRAFNAMSGNREAERSLARLKEILEDA
jgi:uncharacterized protein YndB with AHSA1/START domain